jgi:hypothetical protein
MNLMIESDKQTRLMIRGFETYSEIFCVVFDRVTMINDNLVTFNEFYWVCGGHEMLGG